MRFIHLNINSLKLISDELREMEKKLGDHKHISCRSFKKYFVDEYERILGKVTLPHYET